MSGEKDRAIVLRVIAFSETSSVVTLFTREMGKISALAKGARRPKSPFEAALDLLAVCRIVYIHKSSSALDLLTEAKLERRFRAASRDLSRLYAGYYVAELLNELTTEGDPHCELYLEAERTLRALDDSGDVRREIMRFELVTLRLLGHLPSLDTCVECGRLISLSRRVAFGQLAGGVLCPNCRVGKRQVISVSSEVIQLLRKYADMQSDVWSQSEVAPKWHGETRAVLNRYLSNLIGRTPRLHQYLGLLAS